MFSTIRDALKLDIWDINYTNVHTHPAILNSGGKLHLQQGVLKRIGGFLYHFAYGIRALFQTRKCTSHGSIFVFATSRNQANSLRPLLPYVKNACWITDRNQVQEGVRFPSFWAHLVSLFFIPVVLLKFWQGRRLHNIRIQARYGMDRYLLTYGYYVVARHWLRHWRPKALVVANDSIIYLRAMARAAKDEGITTIYLQHASITHRFPPLAFDYALLDGRDALETYDAIGASKTVVYLIGMPKFDTSYGAINADHTVSALGICVNMLDSVERVEELCRCLHARFPEMAKFLRPHPNEPRKAQWNRLGMEYGFQMSDPRAEDSFAFLNQIDVMIADNSNIHVEAALLNVYPIQYSFSEGATTPSYGFVTSGLCEHYTDPDIVCDKLAQLIEHRPNIRSRAIPYCATIGTAFDGRSSQLAGSMIEMISAGETPSHAMWQPVDRVKMTAFELNQ